MSFLLPLISQTSVKRLPVYTPRNKYIKYFLMFNAAAYGLYQLSSGPAKLAIKNNWEVNEHSRLMSLAKYHFTNFSLTSLLFNGAIFYTLGNYHIAKYGCTHLLTLLTASALSGSILSGLQIQRDSSFEAKGSISLSAGLIAYNIFKNPVWFKYAVGPIGFLSLFALYATFYNDYAAFGGLGAGYLVFLLGL